MNVYIYEMIKGEFKIRKMEYVKPSSPGSTISAKLSEPAAGSPLAEAKKQPQGPPAQAAPAATDSNGPLVKAAPAVTEQSLNTVAAEAVPPTNSESVADADTEVSATSVSASTPAASQESGLELKPDASPGNVPATKPQPPIPSPEEFGEVTFGDVEDS